MASVKGPMHAAIINFNFDVLLIHSKVKSTTFGMTMTPCMRKFTCEFDDWALGVLSPTNPRPGSMILGPWKIDRVGIL